MNPRYHDEFRLSVQRGNQAEVRYTCKVHRDEQFIIPTFVHDLGIPYGDRYFRITVNIMNRDRRAPNPGLRSSVSRHILEVPQNLIARNVRRILLHYSIPREFWNPVTAKISNAAQHMANTTCRSMVVDIMVETFYYEYTRVVEESMEDSYNREYRRVVEESRQSQHQALVPARKTSVEELERVKIGEEEEEEGTSGCSICLEDLKADDQAIRMPCEHLFHSSCILDWLQRRNICPSCRFELPPAVDDD